MRQDIRSSDVFLKADIAAMLRSLALTATMLGEVETCQYVRGYLTALRAVAVALNIESDRSPAGVVGLE